MKNVLGKISESNLIIFLILSILGAAGFYQVYFGSPVFDDYSFIFNSQRFKSVPSIFTFWNKDSFYYRSWPLSFSVLKAIYMLAGDKVFVYKIINLTLHILNSFFLYLIAKKWKISGVWAFFCGLLFLFHPMQVETFSWIFQLKTLLSVFLFFICYLCFLKFLEKENPLYILGAITFYALSLFSKSTAVMMPFLMLAQLLIKYGFTLKNKNAVICYIFFCLCSILSVNSAHETIEGVRLSYYETLEKKEFDESLGELDFDGISLVYRDGVSFKKNNQLNLNKWTLSLYNTSFYFAHFFLGSNNSLVYLKDRFHKHREHIYLAFFSMGTLFIICFGIYFKKEMKNIILSYAFFFLGVFPIIGVYYVPYMKYSYVADHWAYLGIAGLVFLVPSFIQLIREKIKYDLVYISSVAIVMIFLSFSMVRGVLYNIVFNDKYNVLLNALNENPNEPSLYFTLSEYYKEDFKPGASREMYTKAIGNSAIGDNLIIQNELLKHYQRKGLSEKAYETMAFMGIKYVESGDSAKAQEAAKDLSAMNSFLTVDKYILALDAIINLRDDRLAEKYLNKLFPTYNQQQR